MKIKIGSWERKVNMTVAIIDYFDFVLGLDFMTKVQTIPFPVASCLTFFGKQLCVVLATILPKSKKRIISTIQFKKGLKIENPPMWQCPSTKAEIAQIQYPLE